MAYKTINVKAETYGRLLLYKHAGLSFDEVLNEMMDMIPEEKFYRIILKEHKRRMKTGDFAKSPDLSKALKEI